LLPDFVDSANVRVVQGGSRLRLALKASQGLRVVSDVVWQEFQGDKTMQR